MKIKIIGAGSAGNHMAFALTTLKEVKKVIITDINQKALVRSKKDIFIKRYGKWNNKIRLELENENLKTKQIYDGIVIASPPEFHKDNINDNLFKSNNFLIEKPLCIPDKKHINFFEKVKKNYKSKRIYTGYNHRLFPSTVFLKKILKKEKINYCNVSFKENIGGFLKAHNWMKSINESYLSKTEFGGGALCEHSHALNLLQYLVSHKKIKILSKKYQFNDKKSHYHDLFFSAFLKLDKTICEFDQNFKTSPIEKYIIVSTKKKIIKLIYNYEGSNDLIIINNFKKIKKYIFKKTRRDDFIYEAKFFINKIKNKTNSNILDIEQGLSTMKLIAKLLDGIKLS